MRAIVTRAARLDGTMRVPGDKSVSHRAVLFGALARGTTRVTGLAPGGDVRTSMTCVEQLGVTIRRGPDAIEIDSPGRAAFARNASLDAGNSGTTARLLLGMLAPIDGLEARIHGDHSLSRRPMKRVSTPLAKMGARIELTEKGTLPGVVRGTRLHGETFALDVASAQVKTAILLAGLAADGETWVKEPSLSRDHTERLLPAFGGSVREGPLGTGVTATELTGAGHLAVPGDPSSAAFFAAAAALVPGARLRIEQVGTNPTRLGFVEIARRMGMTITVEDESTAAEPLGTWVCAPAGLTGTEIAGEVVPRAIDEIPVLAVVAACAQGRTVIRDATELRVKESDRLALVCNGLRAMGAEVEELPDGLIIEGGRPLHGARIDSGMDHRIAMSFAIAGLVADGETIIDGAEWADISFPGFFSELARLTGGAVRTE